MRGLRVIYKEKSLRDWIRRAPGRGFFSLFYCRYRYDDGCGAAALFSGHINQSAARRKCLLFRIYGRTADAYKYYTLRAARLTLFSWRRRRRQVCIYLNVWPERDWEKDRERERDRERVWQSERGKKKKNSSVVYVYLCVYIVIITEKYKMYSRDHGSGSGHMRDSRFDKLLDFFFFFFVHSLNVCVLYTAASVTVILLRSFIHFFNFFSP